MDFKKNDIIDTVFNRYKESCKCTLETQNYLPIRDRDTFYFVLRKNLLKDIKQVDKEYRKAKRRERREQRRAKRKAKREAKKHKTAIFETETPLLTPEAAADVPPKDEVDKPETEVGEAVAENKLELELEITAESEAEEEYSCPSV